MKWLLRLTGHAKPKTPLPPKPYIDVSHAGKQMSDPRYTNMNDLANIDAEKPHWDDPRFDSREKVPFFDGFGFNRNWSWSIFKMMCMIFPLMFYYEMCLIRDNAEGTRINNMGTIRITPTYSVGQATDDELRNAGFALVGSKDLDHLSVLRKKDSK
jgi:hypothetical protein